MTITYALTAVYSAAKALARLITLAPLKPTTPFVEGPRGFLRGVDLRHFLDTTAELHAFIQGASETLAPWPPRHPGMLPALYHEIANEHHYYMAGRALGFLLLLLAVVLLVALGVNLVQSAPAPPTTAP